jgi:hypothetical protein
LGQENGGKFGKVAQISHTDGNVISLAKPLTWSNGAVGVRQ